MMRKRERERLLVLSGFAAGVSLMLAWTILLVGWRRVADEWRSALMLVRLREHRDMDEARERMGHRVWSAA